MRLPRLATASVVASTLLLAGLTGCTSDDAGSGGGDTIVIGAEINSEMERQTVRDTTEGPEVPMGQRGAHAADTVGPTAEHTPSADEKEQSRGGPAIAERTR